MRTAASPTRKLQELIVYLCDRSTSDPAFELAKLNRLLFHLDFTAYARWGGSMTGGQYEQARQGPTLVGLADVLDDLTSRGVLAIRDADDLGRDRRVFAVRSADLDLFTPREIDLVNRLIDRCRGLPARDTADRFDPFPAVALAAEGELIPYEVALVGTRPPTPMEVRRGEELAIAALT